MKPNFAGSWKLVKMYGIYPDNTVLVFNRWLRWVTVIEDDRWSEMNGRYPIWGPRVDNEDTAW